MTSKSHDDSKERQSLEILKKFRIIIRAAQRYSQRVEKQHGLNGAQLWIMQELEETPGMRVGELATKLAIHQTTTSNLLDALEKRGYVNKTRGTEDQRVVALTLSGKGKEVLSNAPQPTRGILPEALRQLNPAQLEQLAAGLDCLLESLHTVDEESGLQPLPFTM